MAFYWYHDNIIKLFSVITGYLMKNHQVLDHLHFNLIDKEFDYLELMITLIYDKFVDDSPLII